VGPKDDLVVNAGLSVSGLQHVGRLRGEISLAQFLTRSLAGAGRTVLQSLVLYTQDEWKGKPGQLAAFRGDEGAKYVGRRLIDVPDPGGCHASWVDHYWQDFGGVLERFAPGVRIVSTTEAYRNPEMKAIVHDLVSRAEQVRGVVNKYRSRRPYPSGWIPFEAFCDACGTIGARTLPVRLRSGNRRYAQLPERCPELKKPARLHVVGDPYISPGLDARTPPCC